MTYAIIIRFDADLWRCASVHDSPPANQVWTAQGGMSLGTCFIPSKSLFLERKSTRGEVSAAFFVPPFAPTVVTGSLVCNQYKNSV